MSKPLISKDAEVLRKNFGSDQILFIIDKLTPGYVHPCPVEDVETLIHRIPSKDIDGIKFIVFHQPTRKEEVAKPRWAAYYSEFAWREITGSAVFLEAINPGKAMKWDISLHPAAERELEDLKAEGHEITVLKKHIEISLDIESTRKTQLKRSFLHEVGHHVDYKKDPSNFPKKSKYEKELFAEKYVLEQSQRNTHRDL